MLVSDSHTTPRLCNDIGLDCFCVGNGCPTNGWTPQVTRLLCIWWSSSSQAMIQEWSPLDLLPVTGMQWEDAQTVYALTNERQVSLQVGRWGGIVGARTSLNPQQDRLLPLGKFYQLSSVPQGALWLTVLHSLPLTSLKSLSCSNTQHTVERNRELLISALETDGIIGNCTKPIHRWAQQLAFPNFENHCLKERYTNRWSVDSIFQFRRCLCQRFLCVRREGLSS